MARKINLNADMGEGFGAYDIGDDAALLKIVRSANLACAFHAGDPEVARAVREGLEQAGIEVVPLPQMDLG